MNARIHHEVLAYHGAVGGDVTHMLNHRNQCDGGNGEDGVQLELRYAQKLRHNVLIHKGKEVSLSHCGKIAEAKRQADKVACNNGKQNRHQVENPFCKNGYTDDHSQNHHRNQHGFQAEFSVVIKSAVDGGAAQTQADNNDNRAGHDRGQQLVHLFIAENLDQAGKQHIYQAGNDKRALD